MNILVESHSRATNAGSARSSKQIQDAGLAALAVGVNRAESEYRSAGGDSGRPELKLHSLLELAAFVRTNLDSKRRFLVWFDSKTCLLDFGERTYASQLAGADLEDFRDLPSLTIRVVEARGAARAALGAPRRLDDFLWHLGLHSGSGTLAPWLDEKQAYRMKGWPPCFGNDARNQIFRVATMLSREPAKLDDVARTTGMPRTALADLLNACSLAGCLELGGSQPLAETVAPLAEIDSPAEVSHGLPSVAEPAPRTSLALNAIGIVILLAGTAALYLLLTAQPPPAPPVEAAAGLPATLPTVEPSSYSAASALLQGAPRERFHLGTALTPGRIALEAAPLSSESQPGIAAPTPDAQR